MGFSFNWVERIMQFITSVTYSVVVNGRMGDKFTPSWGLRLMESSGAIRGTREVRDALRVTHLLFTDDILIFWDTAAMGTLNVLKVLQSYAKCSSIHLPSVPQEDCLVWGNERSGIYSVHSRYSLLLQLPTPLSSNHEVFKQIWETRCPPKIKIVLWKFVHSFVAIRSCLYNRRVAKNPICSRCNIDHETVNHVLRFCASAKDVRVMLGYPLHMVTAQMDFHEWLLWILKMHHTIKHNEVCVTMWVIWFARNHMVYEGTNQSVIPSYCIDLVSLIPTDSGVASTIQARWSLPPIGLVKINVDARFILNQKKVVAEVVIRDENVKIMEACCKITYLVLLIFVAEALAMIHRL
ncbi:hypothetical protein CXB51_035474 [Gossypium anomalum]|uniref:Reverse transcriptase zinc-binding domain-containing protein n=1 Tax=Gossypium anomalum TaxID=47600 RepID=A0A8J5XP46_9ROSI|nr:hypothetical protein CXB51_035474 [Gossypium anomalum]